MKGWRRGTVANDQRHALRARRRAGLEKGVFRRLVELHRGRARENAERLAVVQQPRAADVVASMLRSQWAR